MLIEQALYHMPEILTGSGYPDQNYESGIVGAVSLAILQSLNGRNTPNPISCLQSERPYRGRQHWPGRGGNPQRYLRADLWLNLSAMKVGSKRLAAYGWRYENWVEAKFFRGSTSNQMGNTAALLADLLRLMALVPDRRSKSNPSFEVNGRYLFHVYESLVPEAYLSVGRQVGGSLEARKWLSPLLASGKNSCAAIVLGDCEIEGIMSQINENLGDLTIQFEATTAVVAPKVDLGQGFRQYTCILSRIDSFSLQRCGATLTVRADGTVEQLPNQADVTSKIREHVGSWINVKGPIETTEPGEDETEEPESSEDYDDDTEVSETSGPSAAAPVVPPT